MRAMARIPQKKAAHAAVDSEPPECNGIHGGRTALSFGPSSWVDTRTYVLVTRIIHFLCHLDVNRCHHLVKMCHDSVAPEPKPTPNNSHTPRNYRPKQVSHPHNQPVDKGGYVPRGDQGNKCEQVLTAIAAKPYTPPNIYKPGRDHR